MLRDIVNTIKYTIEKGRYISKSSMDKGETLEREVFDIIQKEVKGYKKVLVDLLIPRGSDGKSTQIDVVIVHKSGITVVECKNYNALVVGDAEDEQWGVVYSNGTEYTLYNPIKQNIGHIYSVIDKLSSDANLIYKRYYYRNIVVFGDKTELNNGNIFCEYSGYKTLLSPKKDFLNGIGGLNDSKEILSKEEIKKIYKVLSKYSRSKKSAKAKHSAYVKSVQNK